MEHTSSSLASGVNTSAVAACSNQQAFQNGFNRNPLRFNRVQFTHGRTPLSLPPPSGGKAPSTPSGKGLRVPAVLAHSRYAIALHVSTKALLTLNRDLKFNRAVTCLMSVYVATTSQSCLTP